MIWLWLLDVFFLILIICQIYNAFFVIEGLQGQTAGQGQTAEQGQGQQNHRIGQLIQEIQDLSGNLVDLSGNVQTLQEQVNSLAQSQQQYATQLTGGSAPQITGT